MLHIVGTASVLIVSGLLLLLSILLRDKQPLRSRGALHYIVLGVMAARSAVLFTLHMTEGDNEVLECYLDIFVADPFTVLVSSMLLSQSVRYLLVANANRFKYNLLGKNRRDQFSEQEILQSERVVERNKMTRLRVLHALSKTWTSLFIAAVLVAVLMALSIAQVVTTNGQCIGSDVFGYVQLVWDILVRVIAVIPLVYDLLINSKHLFQCRWRRMLLSNDPHMFRIELLLVAVPFVLAGVYEGLEQAFPDMDEDFPPLQPLVEYPLQLWILVTFCGFVVACTVARAIRERTVIRSGSKNGGAAIGTLEEDELVIQSLMKDDTELQDMFDAFTACEEWCGELLLFHREMKPIALAIQKHRDMEQIPPAVVLERFERLREIYVTPNEPLAVALSDEARTAIEQTMQLFRSIRAAAEDTPSADNSEILHNVDELLAKIRMVQSEVAHQLRELAERFMVSSPYKNHQIASQQV